MKLALALLVASAGIAHAKESPAVPAARALLAEQLDAINAHDAGAFAFTFDTAAYMIFPTTTEAASRTAIERGAKVWLGGLGKTRVVLDHARYAALDDSNAWISAELVATGATPMRWRLTEMVAPIGAGYRVLAAHVSEPIEDKVALAATLPALPDIDGGMQPLGGEVNNPTDMTGLEISADPAVTLIGSAPNELITGKAAVAAKVKEFKGLTWRWLRTLDVGEQTTTHPAVASVSHASVTFKIGKKDVVVPFRILIITYSPAKGKTILAAVHFSIAQRP